MNCHYSILISVNLCQKKDGRRGNKEFFSNRAGTVAKNGVVFKNPFTFKIFHLL